MWCTFLSITDDDKVPFSLYSPNNVYGARKVNGVIEPSTVCFRLRFQKVQLKLRWGGVKD